MQAKGRVFKYGDNVDTDVIIPARYLNMTKGEDLAKHCMEDIDKEFVNKVQKGDIIVAQKNFGCGSSREHAPLVIKCAGVSCVDCFGCLCTFDDRKSDIDGITIENSGKSLCNYTANSCSFNCYRCMLS